MAANITLERILTEVEALPAEEQVMLEELLQKRRAERWRQQTAADARKAVRAIRTGKLKPESVNDVIARLQAGLQRGDD